MVSESNESKMTDFKGNNWGHPFGYGNDMGSDVRTFGDVVAYEDLWGRCCLDGITLLYEDSPDGEESKHGEASKTG